MFVFTKHLTTSVFFFSAYDFQPCPCQGGITTFGTPMVFINPNPGAKHIDGYFTGGETEEEWVDNDTQLARVSA
jgi:hypothetical protein